MLLAYRINRKEQIDNRIEVVTRFSVIYIYFYGFKRFLEYEIYRFVEVEIEGGSKTRLDWNRIEIRID